MILTDPVNLLCDLIEARVGSFEASTLRSEAAQAVEFLAKIGALMPGQLTRVLTCRACHDDHPVHLEFDSTTRRHWHFCPEAGRVMVEDDVLATIRVDPEWVLDWLVTVLPITPPVRRRLLVPTLAWHLGDAHIGGTELAVSQISARWPPRFRSLLQSTSALCSLQVPHRRGRSGYLTAMNSLNSGRSHALGKIALQSRRPSSSGGSRAYGKA
jgi:hypothetical protein